MPTKLQTLRRANIQIPIQPPPLGGRSLPVMQIAQEQTQWCWAACAEMVIRYYGTAVRQCDEANFLRQRNDCCAAPSSNACNQPCQVDDVARVYTNWGITCTPQLSQVPFATLSSEIDASRPVEVAFYWTGGGGHVAIVRGHGQHEGKPVVQVNDPAYGTGVTFYESLRTAYGQGQWAVTWTNIRKV